MNDKNSKDKPGIIIKSKKPIKTKFHQQSLKGWSPNFKARNIASLFLGSGAFKLVITLFAFGIQRGILNTNVDYTHCTNSNGSECSKILSLNISIKCVCQFHFQLFNSFPAPVYFYYQLNNYYQNHRRFLSSRDDYQLNGEISNHLDSDCEPIRYALSKTTLKYAPCGLVANALFNDSFQLFLRIGNKSIVVPWSNENIAWHSDKTVIFGIPKTWNNTIKPPSWNMTALERNPKAYAGDEEFIVWMRPASLPTVKKLHRILHKTSSPFDNGLPKGSYVLIINYKYPVTAFNGSKSMFISTTGIFGGRNNFICYLFLCLSVIHLMLGILLMILERYSENTIRSLDWLIEIHSQPELPIYKK